MTTYSRDRNSRDRVPVASQAGDRRTVHHPLEPLRQGNPPLRRRRPQVKSPNRGDLPRLKTLANPRDSRALRPILIPSIDRTLVWHCDCVTRSRTPLSPGTLCFRVERPRREFTVAWLDKSSRPKGRRGEAGLTRERESESGVQPSFPFRVKTTATEIDPSSYRALENSKWLSSRYDRRARE